MARFTLTLKLGGWGLILLVLWVFLLPLPAWVRPYRLGKVPEGGQAFGCGLSYLNSQGGGPRNTFGPDCERYAIRARDRYPDALGAMDSDGNRTDSQEQLRGGTYPGDASTMP